MNTDDLDQFVIIENHPSAPGMFSLRRVTQARPIGIHVAAHKNIEAVRLAIPTTHVIAPHQQPGGIVEVWIDRRVADAPGKLPPRRCPCGDMTANDCAGECGRMDRR